MLAKSVLESILTSKVRKLCSLKSFCPSLPRYWLCPSLRVTLVYITAIPVEPWARYSVTYEGSKTSRIAFMLDLHSYTIFSNHLTSKETWLIRCPNAIPLSFSVYFEVPWDLLRTFSAPVSLGTGIPHRRPLFLFCAFATGTFILVFVKHFPELFQGRLSGSSYLGSRRDFGSTPG